LTGLSDSKLRNLKGREKDYKAFDGDGLFVKVTPNGSRLWRLKYRFDNKEKLLALGRYPEISLKEARARAFDARRDIANGIDPSQERKAQKAARCEANKNSFSAIADELIEKVRREGKSEVTIRKLISFFEMVRPGIGKQAITDIKAPDILKILKRIEDEGKYETANRVKASVSRVFKLAIASGRAEYDPTFGLQGALITKRAKSRAAITDPKRYGALLRHIDRYNGQPATRLGLQLLALLATRPGELRKAKWDQFDFEECVWSIPAEVMKMRATHRVPLPKAAVNALSELREINGWGDLCFPSATSSKKPISENTFNQAIRRMGFGADEMTSHGFRSTFSTFANESGLWKPDAIERALAHVEKNNVRRAYDRSEHWDERIRMADWWAGYLEELRAD